MKRKALAMVLALCMVLSMLPATALAAQPKPAPQSSMMTPGAVSTLAPAAVSPNASSYSVTLTSSGKGEAGLLVDSPAQAGSEVYFMANPDDGYLAEVYYEGLSDGDLVYVGADVIGFIMPANKVKLDVRFVAAQGSSHSINVYTCDNSGQYSLTRTSAKPFESVILAVLPDNAADFDPLGYVWAGGAPFFYLFEDGGIHYYEIIMDEAPVNVFIAYRRGSANPIVVSTNGDPNGGTVTVSPESAYVNDLVTVTVKPNPGFRVTGIYASSHNGDLKSEVTLAGTNRYTFRMHPNSTTLWVTFTAEERNVTVNAGAGGTAYANVTRAKVGSAVTLTCVPDSGFQVDQITGVEGLTRVSENVYRFTMPNQDVTVNVTFKSTTYPINLSVETGLGGTASVSHTQARVGETVTITCAPQAGYRVARIAGVDSLTKVSDTTYTFPMPAQSVDIQVLFLRSENPFLDVNETHFFYESVLWAVDQDITSGMSADAFGPFAICNRAQVVTFLWRYAGSPEPTGTENPFTDVPAGSFFYKPVLWALENGITNGLSDTEFGATQNCNRAQVVTFLWRMLKQPDPALTEHPFSDVQAGSWYEKPVLWALSNGITNGTSDTTFGPAGECLRAQVVTFLYRTAQLP